MKYDRIKRAEFIERKNRFTATILIDGKEELCHIKTTGRCRELFINGADIFVQENISPVRKTKYDLISVYKQDLLVNTDSQVSNTVALEIINQGRLFNNIIKVKPEYKKLNSRFDFLVELENNMAFIEVKGVTLEDDGVALFPDAPTERGLKHVKELISLIEAGFKACIVFIVQMDGIEVFRPNARQDRAFAEALKKAKEKGVIIRAFNCNVTFDGIYPAEEIEVQI
ncbi:MAG: DNA/RNA nuclease SfsA [Clostridiales bacterium]|jgi:sugar fermentation stimulation protein A|nr:DNA/RNA nuclease SfsA [Clostridiales bacterium]